MNTCVRIFMECILVFLFGSGACVYAPVSNPIEASNVSGQSYDSCEYYKLIMKGIREVADYDSILSKRRKTVYKSKELEKSIFFQQGVPSEEIVYLHSRFNGTVWKTYVTCNESNLPSRTVEHLISVSEELLAALHARYNFNEIYFYCSIF